jgi:hypothetical protein
LQLLNSYHLENTNNLILLNEETIKDLRKGIESKVKKRAKPLKSNLVSVKSGTINFLTPSFTQRGAVSWKQSIRVLHLAKILKPYWDGKKSKLLPLLREALKGDILVHCSCPAFKWWGYAYIASERKYKIGRSQKIYPHVRNPHLKGTVCKHLYNVLYAIPFLAPKIVQLFKKDQGVK